MQNALCSGFGARIGYRRYRNQRYTAVEREVHARESWSRAAIRDFARTRLIRMVEHCAANVPFYQRLFQEHGFSSSDLIELSDIGRLPILDKQTARANAQAIQPTNLRAIPHQIVQTSGTTGAGLAFPLSLAAEQEQWAIWWRYRARYGLTRTTWYAHFYGRSIVPFRQHKPPFWRTNWAGRQILFSAYHMSPENLPAYIAHLNRRRPPWIQGYPSLLTVLAAFMLEKGLSLSYQPIAVTVGAESLLPHQKSTIEQAFGMPCRQHYGMTEAVANISECPSHRLHVDDDFSLVEFVPIGGGLHRIIATGFANDAFPLLRFDVGDIAEFDESDTCNCGLPGRVVRAIDGRKEDYVLTPDGRRIGRLDHIFKAALNVTEAQIYQPDRQRLVFRIATSHNYHPGDEDALRCEAEKRVGNDMDISFQYVKSVPRTPRGKIRFVVSDVAEAQVPAED